MNQATKREKQLTQFRKILHIELTSHQQQISTDTAADNEYPPGSAAIHTY